MDFWQVIQNRRSVREFQDKPVPEKYLRKIIAAASFAPSGSNRQNWHFIIVKDRTIRDELKKAIEEKMQALTAKMKSARAKKEFLSYSYYFTFFAKAPVLIAVVAKPYDSLSGRILNKYEPGTTYVSTAGIQSVAAAIENMLLAVANLGLGACWMTGPLIAKAALEKILKIELPEQLLALVPIGFPKSKPKPHQLPKSIAKIITVI